PIANPAAQPQSPSLALGGRSEIDALHAPSNEELKLLQSHYYSVTGAPRTRQLTACGSPDSGRRLAAPGDFEGAGELVWAPKEPIRRGPVDPLWSAVVE